MLMPRLMLAICSFVSGSWGSSCWRGIPEQGITVFAFCSPLRRSYESRRPALTTRLLRRLPRSIGGASDAVVRLPARNQLDRAAGISSCWTPNAVSRSRLAGLPGRITQRIWIGTESKVRRAFRAAILVFERAKRSRQHSRKSDCHKCGRCSRGLTTRRARLHLWIQMLVLYLT